MSAVKQQVSQLKNLINFSVSEFATHKPDLEALWVNKGHKDTISRLLDHQNGIIQGQEQKDINFTQYDLIDALKEFIRNSNIFKSDNPYINNFVERIKQIESENRPNNPGKFQNAMEILLLELAQNDNIEKSYCIYQFLYLVRHIFHPHNQDDFFKCALVVGPIFQEAFGKKDDPDMVPIFYHAFAYIIADNRYDQTYHMLFSQVTDELEILERLTIMNENIQPQPKKQQKPKLVEEPTFNPPKPQAKKDASFREEKQNVFEEPFKTPPPKPDEQSKKGFEFKKEDWDKTKENAIKWSNWLWQHTKTFSKFAWKYIKIGSIKAWEAFQAFRQSDFYKNMKIKFIEFLKVCKAQLGAFIHKLFGRSK